MSDKYQNPGVPHYSPIDAPRPTPVHLDPAPISEDVKNMGGIAKATEHRDSLATLREKIDAAWKSGDEFRIALPERWQTAYPEIQGRRGKFLSVRWRKDHTMDVLVEWLGEPTAIDATHRRWKLRNRTAVSGGIFRVSAVKS